MNYYEQIKGLLISNEVYKKVKDYSKNKSDLETYYNVVKILIDAQGGETRAKYGNRLIEEYSKKLMKELNDKKYSERNLRNMRQFYVTFKDEIWNPVGSKLYWTHIKLLLPIKDKNKRNYFLNLCVDNNLGKRELETRIKSNEYERLPEETKNKLINNKQLLIQDTIKNPILIRNNTNNEIISEKALQFLILENISSF